MEGWAIATCEALLLVGAAAVGWTSHDFWRVPKRLWLPALLVVVLIAIGLLQLVPLPASWWQAAGSERYARFAEGAQAEALLHSDAYRADPFGPQKAPPRENWTPLTPKPPSWIAASFTPAATGRALLALAAALCLILLLERLAEEGKGRLRRLGWVAGTMGLLVALVALVEYQNKAREALLWIRLTPHAAGAFGPFVNPNHGEAFVNVALPLLYYLIWRVSCSQKKRADRVGMRVVALALLVLHVTVLSVSHSRGAFLALSLYPLAWIARKSGTPQHNLRRAMAAGYLALLIAVMVFGFWTGLATDHGRIVMDLSVPRSDFFLGHGLNSFEERFPAEVSNLPIIGGPCRNTHLENEYLQLFFEGGLLPAFCGLLTGAAVIYLAFRLALEGRAAFWLAPALTGEALHASVDFTGHVFPIVGVILLACILGMVALEGNGDYAPLRGRSSRKPPEAV